MGIAGELALEVVKALGKEREYRRNQLEILKQSVFDWSNKINEILIDKMSGDLSGITEEKRKEILASAEEIWLFRNECNEGDEIESTAEGIPDGYFWDRTKYVRLKQLTEEFLLVGDEIKEFAYNVNASDEKTFIKRAVVLKDSWSRYKQKRERLTACISELIQDP